MSNTATDPRVWHLYWKMRELLEDLEQIRHDCEAHEIDSVCVSLDNASRNLDQAGSILQQTLKYPEEEQ